MDHVGVLRWHAPKTKKDTSQWAKMLNRGGNRSKSSFCIVGPVFGYRDITLFGLVH